MARETAHSRSRRTLSRPRPVLARQTFQARASLFSLLVLMSVSMLAYVELGLKFPLTTAMILVFTLCCSVLFVPFLFFNPSKSKWLMAAFFLAAVLALHLTPWTPRKPFLRDLGSVRLGMSPEEVQRVMSRWFVADPQPFSPESSATNAMVFHHSLAGTLQTDAGVVEFANGRVVNVEFRGGR